MNRTRTLSFLAVLLAAVATTVQAQQPRTERIGHIVAIVGDSVILNFDIQSGVLAYEAQARTQVTDPEQRRQLEQEILQDRIDGLLIIQAALRDTTIIVPEDQVTRLVQQEVERQQRALGGVVQFEQALQQAGLTLQDYRERIAAQIRSAEYVRQYQSNVRGRRKAPPATEADLRELFEERREQFGERPATITFQQISVLTQPTAAALARAKARADSVFNMLGTGGNFEELARRYSDDVSRESGGDLGWSRRTEWVRDFSNVAFSLRPGQISPPVRTQFGYHIIKAERARGAEMHLRHILFRPELTDDDAVRARARADTVAERLRAGADANELYRQYGDQDKPLRNGPAPLDTVATSLRLDLSQVTAGQVLGPIPAGGAQVAQEFIVLRVLEREAARPWTLTDPLLREQLRRDVEIQKLMREVLDELRRSTYVEIRGAS